MPLNRLLTYVVKMAILCMTIFCLDQYQMEIVCSASLSLVGDNSLVYELRAMAAVELHIMELNGQHPALKSVYEKRQPVMGGKLFSSL